jgi:DNA-binding MarR family transcriptional regulator
VPRPTLEPTVPGMIQQVARASAAQLRADLAAQAMTGLRPVHTYLLIPLLGGGRRASDLADSFAVSRQAIAQMIHSLEANGYVERIVDPGDARAKLICLTAKGRAALRVVRASAQRLERAWQDRIGAARLEELGKTLALLVPSPGASADPS